MQRFELNGYFLKQAYMCDNWQLMSFNGNMFVCSRLAISCFNAAWIYITFAKKNMGFLKYSHWLAAQRPFMKTVVSTVSISPKVQVLQRGHIRVAVDCGHWTYWFYFSAKSFQNKRIRTSINWPVYKWMIFFVPGELTRSCVFHVNSCWTCEAFLEIFILQLMQLIHILRIPSCIQNMSTDFKKEIAYFNFM